MFRANPVINVEIHGQVTRGLSDIAEFLHTQFADHCVIAIEVYPGVDLKLVEELVTLLKPSFSIEAECLFQPTEQINKILAPDITDDRIFGRRTLYSFQDFLDQEQTELIQKELARRQGRRIIWGTGAGLLRSADVLIYADLTRWEAILRYRTTKYANWMADNSKEDPSRKIKRSYFVEWVMADKLKQEVADRVSWYLDMNRNDEPVLVEAVALARAYKEIARRPFRLRPFFDEGVWGGTWMQETFGVEQDKRNLAWSFDGVPEENSLLIGFNDGVVETPASNLVFAEPVALMGERVYGRFGYSFPIRFDFLDTMNGQNLSLQVHPQTTYIQDVFGMPYTQDESYYIIEANPGTHVYAGLKNDIDRDEMINELRQAERGEIQFPADHYVNQVPVKAHDHISYPGGTIHCSGAGMVVLEISSTPNRFTFKLWDWDRVDLDGLPRPINLGHGIKNIDWSRNTDYVYNELFNQISVIEEGEGYRHERTGLHEREFIETQRHWFTVPVEHKSNGSVRMLNLVAGEAVLVESTDGSYPPLEVHYGETFIVPASCGNFVVKPLVENPTESLATIEASVR